MSGSLVLAGELKHLKIGSVPRGLPVRPILARIKKSLFDILRNRIPDSRFLDLFAGSGSVGLEALSRGASKVVMVEADPRCKRWIEETLRRAEEHHAPFLAGRTCRVVLSDVLAGLAHLNESFDLIFSGAPYHLADATGSARGKKPAVLRGQKFDPVFFVEELFKVIERDRLLKSGGWFIAQHQARETFQAAPPWDFFRQEEYGDTRLSFFRYVGGR